MCVCVCMNVYNHFQKDGWILRSVKTYKMIYLCCFHIATQTIKKAEPHLKYSFTTKIKIRKTLWVKPGRWATVQSWWFIFCIPLPWIFRVKLSKLHVFACRINHEREPENQRYERTNLSLQSSVKFSSSSRAANTKGRLCIGKCGPPSFLTLVDSLAKEYWHWFNTVQVPDPYYSPCPNCHQHGTSHSANGRHRLSAPWIESGSLWKTPSSQRHWKLAWIWLC